MGFNIFLYLHISEERWERNSGQRDSKLLTNGSHETLAGESLSGASLGGHYLLTVSSPSVIAHPQEFPEQELSNNNTTKYDPHHLFVIVHGMAKGRLG